MSAAELSCDLPGGAHVWFTTREHGNMSSVGGEGFELGEQARARVRQRIGVRQLARGYQVHGAVVRRVVAQDADSEQDSGRGADRAATGDIGEADGQATALRDVGAMVLTADCLPVALGAKGAVAMVHAGWRGLTAAVLEEGVRAVRELDGAGEMVAIIGPGAGPCCYEVGEEVHAAFGGAHRVGQNIDLKAIARERLLAAGVAEVLDVAACTICDQRFFSHRREGTRAGRQGGVAWLS